MNKPVVQEINLPYKPRRLQMAIHETMKFHRFTVAVCHRRFGKSVAAVNALILAAIAKSNSRLAYVGPTLKQAKGICWAMFKEYAGDIPNVQFREAELRVIFPNHSEIQLFAGESHDSARGHGFDGMVCDEIGDYPPDAWPSSFRATLSDKRGWCLFVGTPKGQNLFYELFVRGQSEQYPDWTSLVFRADETGVLPADELESAREIGPQAFAREYLCDFDASTDDVLIPLTLLSEACSREVVQEQELHGMPRIIGVDVARFGSDSSVIARRWGKLVLDPVIIENADLMQLAGIVAQAIDKFHPDAVMIDETGLGAGLVDRLRQAGHRVFGINFGAKAPDLGYTNMRVFMWDKLKDWLQSGGVLPNLPIIKADLSSPTYSFDSSNRMKLESKADIKKRLGRSPDLGDAIALTFAMSVRAKGTDHIRPSKKQKRESPSEYFARRLCVENTRQLSRRHAR